MTLSLSHQGAIESALSYIMRGQQYRSDKADSGIKFDYERIWIDNFNFILSRYGNLWALKTTTASKDEDLEAQYGEGWTRLPADWVRFEPNLYHGNINLTTDGERIAQVAGQTFTYVYLPDAIDNLPYEFLEAAKWRFLAQISLRDAALMEKSGAIADKARRAMGDLIQKITIENQKRKISTADRGGSIWRKYFL